MDEQETFDLEDIVREFGGGTPEAQEDTVPLDGLPGEGKQPASAPDAQEEVREYVPKSKPKQEPPKNVFFEEDWEPEYEEPFGEYTAPIPFLPKRKPQPHVKERNDPEKRYRQLRERNYGAQQAGLFVLVLLFVLSALPAVLVELTGLTLARMKVFSLVELLLMLVAALVGRYRLAEAIADLIARKPGLSSLLLVSFLLCGADSLVCLSGSRLPCCALFNLQLLMAELAAYQKQLTEMSQMDTLRKAQKLQAVVRCENYYEEKPGFVLVPGEREDFLEAYDQPAEPEQILNLYTLVAMIAGVVLGILGAIRGGIAAGWQVMLGAILVAVPATAFISQCAPARSLEKRLHKLGALICGWQGIRLSGGRAMYPLRHSDIFPEGSVDLNGMKFPGRVPMERVLEIAASMVSQEGGGLTDPFLRQVSTRSGHLHPVEDLNSYDGGLSALVDGAPTILGSVEFMQQMGVALPKSTQLAQAVYIAIDGELAGVFAVSIKKNKSASGGLRTLCGDGQLEPIVTSEDFLVTTELLRLRFAANTDRVRLPEQPIRRNLSAFVPAEDAPAVALVTHPGLAQKAFPVTGARALKTAMGLGAALHIFGGCLGLAAVLILAWVGGAQMLTAGNLTMYSLLWMLPGFLATLWTKYI